MSSNNNVLINLSLTFSWIFMYILYLIGQLSIPLLPIHAFFACIIIYVNTLPDNTIKIWKNIHIPTNNADNINKMISKDSE
jgi:hypothetical protein